MRREYSMLMGERLPDDHDNTYRLRGLPEGGNFRDGEEYDTLLTAWLKVEGVGFSAPAFEFSQHGTTVVVEQETPGGSAHITFEK